MVLNPDEIASSEIEPVPGVANKSNCALGNGFAFLTLVGSFVSSTF